MAQIPFVIAAASIGVSVVSSSVTARLGMSGLLFASKLLTPSDMSFAEVVIRFFCLLSESQLATKWETNLTEMMMHISDATTTVNIDVKDRKNGQC